MPDLASRFTRSLCAYRTGLTAGVGMICLLGVFAGSGCGGHSSSSNSNTTPITVTLDWPARSRDVNAPSSALSCIITLQSGNTTTGGYTDFPVINRQTSTTAAYTQTWVSATAVRTGSNLVDIRYYAQPDGVGSVVADLQKAVTINSDGTGIGPFTVTSNVASVTVTPNQTVNIGNTTAIAFAAYDSTAAQIAGISEGSAFFAAASNTNVTVTAGGDLTGTLLGTTTVTATVDGITSAPVSVASIVGTSTLTTTADGLQYRDIVVGTGAPYTAGQTVNVGYALYLTTDGGSSAADLDSGNYTLNQTNFGTSSPTFPFTLGTGQVIPGFDEGVTGMAAGGTRILVVPPTLGYGINPPSGIPSNATLIFIVKIPASGS